MAKKITAVILLASILLSTVLLTGCRESERVSYNVSKEADNFNVYRRIVVMNCIKGETLFELEGWLSIEEDDNGLQLVILAEVGEGEYKKHIIGLSDNVTYTLEDISGAKVSKYHYEINYNPKLWLPVTFKYED